VRIGAIPALALSLLPPAILEWTARYPDIACELSSDHSRELVQKLLMREVDLALTLQLPDHPGLRPKPGQRCAGGAGAKGLLAGAGRQAFAIDGLAGAPLIGLSSADPLAARLDSYLEASNRRRG
jgi:DNA-binding transcriptional LysR family regulator